MQAHTSGSTHGNAAQTHASKQFWAARAQQFEKAGKGKASGAILKALDMDRRIEPKAYFRKLDDLHDKLREIQQAYIGTTEAAVIVLEGWDTAGKGGAIRRITTAMDPRSVKVWPIASPREYYRERHYLARFWERLPPNGAISIFDRSWYGRVMVERVE